MKAFTEAELDELDADNVELTRVFELFVVAVNRWRPNTVPSSSGTIKWHRSSEYTRHVRQLGVSEEYILLHTRQTTRKSKRCSGVAVPARV